MIKHFHVWVNYPFKWQLANLASYETNIQNNTINNSPTKLKMNTNVNDLFVNHLAFNKASLVSS